MECLSSTQRVERESREEGVYWEELPRGECEIDSEGKAHEYHVS
jgi:hypothetical protein